MNSVLQYDYIVYRVKDYLKKNNIKLWMDPYYNNKGLGADEILELQLLSEQIAEILNIPQDFCSIAIKDLQRRALARLKSDSVFKETGVATIKIKISGKHPETVSVDISLTSNIESLTEKVSEITTIQTDRLKLIFKGRVLQTSETLISQGIKNGSQLMAVVMEDQGSLQESENRIKIVEQVKKNVKLLAGRSDLNNDMYFQIENQSGEALNIPPNERQALVTAMALHDKGRTALKNKDYAFALILFLEADKEFSDCASELLDACDNYALLNLDISWCYLCLRSAAEISDADRRLSICEQSLKKSYGANMERLLAIKGTTGNEMCLFVRLHVLRGVVYFHQNRREEAKRMFEQAWIELNNLKVDDNSLSSLMELGYSYKEARIGLYATYGNIEAAEKLINQKRIEKEQTEEQNLIKLKNEREHIQLGLCQNGKQFCDPKLVNQLQAMGFSRLQSIEALRMSNNVISEAISIIQETPHLLKSYLSEEEIAKLASLGYDIAMIQDLLESCSAPLLQKAIKSLSSITDSSGPSTSADNQLNRTASAITFIEELQNTRKKQIKEEKKAYKQLSKDFLKKDDSSENNFDIDLVEEEQFIMEYMSLLD